jgi:hypothetical protein
MAGSGRKVFTAGDVLTASDVQNYMMDQSVMYFAGTAARSSAIATPTTGMTTYIGTTGTASIPQIETYTGSAWQTPYGLTLVGRASVTTASSISFDNVFSANFNNYLVIFDLVASAASQLNVQLRVGGVNNTSNAYVVAAFYMEASGAYGAAYTGLSTSAPVAGLGTGKITNAQIHIANPFLASRTGATVSQSSSRDGLTYFSTFGGWTHDVATSYDGFSFIPSTGTMTGNIRIYGLRNA